MTPKSNAASPLNQPVLIKRMVIGGGIGLLLISLFLFTAGEPKPEWGRFWMIRPLILVPFAGAMGGLCNYFIFHYHSLLRVHKAIAIILSVLVFIIGLWMGTIVGLDGTYWD